MCIRDSTNIVMNDNVLEVTSAAKHMGVKLCTDKKSEKLAIDERIGGARTALLAARGMGNNFSPVPPNVLSKLYWSICIPKLVYGLDVTHIDFDSFEQLETAHRINAKNIQGVSMTAATPAPLGTIGWLTLKAYVDIIFIIRTCCLPNESFYNMLCYTCLLYTSPSPRGRQKSRMPSSA